MVSRQFISIVAWISIVSGLGLTGFGLYSVGFNNNPSYAIPLLVIGILIFITGVVLYIVAERRQKEEKQLVKTGRAIRKSQIIPTDAIEPEFSEPLAQRRAETIPKKSITQKAKKKNNPNSPVSIRRNNIPEDDICMISKLPLTKSDTVSQCPNCKAYFLEQYLSEWLDENGFCPVCHHKLKN